MEITAAGTGMPATSQRIFITGADGFIGSHLTEELVRSGCRVRALVLYNSFNSWGWLDHCEPEIKKSLEVVPGDVRDPAGIKQAMKGCDLVLHLAALISIPYSYQCPFSFLDTNISGTLNILQAAGELGVQKVVHTSTSEVYGSARFVPINEEHPLQAQSPYAASKIGADQMALSFHASFGTPVTIIRPFNTYGPRQSARAVIPNIIAQIAMGQKKVHLGSLHTTRDFNYIKDVVQGYLAVAKADHVTGEVINIGSNFEISIGETLELIAGLMDAEIEVETDPRRIRPDHSEVERLWADNAKAKRLTGWEPRYASREGFRKGLAETIEWFTVPENLRHYKTDLYNF